MCLLLAMVEWAAVLILAGLSCVFNAQLAISSPEIASTGIPGFSSLWSYPPAS